MSIKNGDLPAMPVQHMDYMHVKDKSYCNGLTKREQFAMAAMQGLLVNMGRNGFDNVSVVAVESVMAAEALLSELERTK